MDRWRGEGGREGAMERSTKRKRERDEDEV